MTKLRLLVAFLTLLAGSLPAVTLARPHSTASPSPAPIADPAITKLVTQQFVQWQAGEVNKSLYKPEVLDKLTDAKIADVSQAIGRLGALTNVVYIGPWIEPDFPADVRGYIYQMQCSDGNVYLWLALDGQGKIATIFFRDRLDVETVTPSPSPRGSP